MKNSKAKAITMAAAIAAVYVVLTFIANAMGLASGAIQVRFSEALTVLPFFTPVAVPGLFVGCILSNILTGCAPYDVVFGSLATLIGAVGTYVLAKKLPKMSWLAPIPPIIANTIIVPFVLMYVYDVEDALWYLMLTVGAGEVISCGIIGMILLKALEKRKEIFNK